MIAAKIDRFWRLIALGFLFSLLFPDARAYIIVILIFGVYFYLTSKKFQWSKQLITVVAVLLALGLYGLNHYSQIQIQAAHERTMEVVADGKYTGEAEGHRDVVEVELTIEDGQITGVQIDEADTPEYAQMATEGMKERMLEEQSLTVATVSGATVTSEAILEAAQNAVEIEDDEFQLGPLEAFISFVTSGLWATPTLFQMVVVFIGIIVVDFTLQAVLVHGTGESLNCMNCQACVGVCPVRHVEGGKPLPMQIALSSRMGDYEEVKNLLEYCVGCGRCSGRCPNGVSPVMLAGRSKVINDNIRGERN